MNQLFKLYRPSLFFGKRPADVELINKLEEIQKIQPQEFEKLLEKIEKEPVPVEQEC